jgi:hypothetical protein
VQAWIPDIADSPITAAEFLELKAMLLTMTGEGSAVPVGWTVFPNDEEDSEASLECSKYDFLLIQSLQVFFAKILGLYFVDTDVIDNTYYDYKVTAEWPTWLKRRLDYELVFDTYTSGQTFFPVTEFDDRLVMIGAGAPVVVDEPYDLFRTVNGLEITTPANPFVLTFALPVNEVQLVIINTGFADGNINITVEAYRNLYGVYTDKQVLLVERGMLRLRGPEISQVKIYGAKFVICRVHYEVEEYPEGLQQDIACGLKKHNHLPLSVPEELTASFIPGGTITDQDGVVTEKPYLAGLRWKTNEQPDRNLISISPIMYHLERRVNGGAVEWVTEDSPLFVTPSVIESASRNIPPGWPQKRQYYTEAVTHDQVTEYRIAAVDLFGRQSDYSEIVTYEVSDPKPPPPENVSAKFLDFSTYDAVANKFADVTLNEQDQGWLRRNEKNAIVVEWTWPENLQLQAPDVEGFRVRFKQGWLNNYTGVISSEISESVIHRTSAMFTNAELEKYAILETFNPDIPVYTFDVNIDIYPVPPPRPNRFLIWLLQ